MPSLLDWMKTSREPWGTSKLSMHGAPVEFAFSSADPGLRYTVEVADPATDPRSRLVRAVDQISTAGITIPNDIIERLARFQHHQPLKYGAWVGVRHDADSDRFKLYVETPRARAHDADQWSTILLGEPPVFPGEGARIEMIGYEPHARRVEFYHQVENMHPFGIKFLLERLGLERRARDVLALLQGAYAFPLHRSLPSNVCGYSYSASRNGGEPVFTFYLFAVSLFGGDGYIRDGISRLAEANGWDLTYYPKLTKTLHAHDSPHTHHGLFGVVIREDIPAHISLGVSPPDRGVR